MPVHGLLVTACARPTVQSKSHKALSKLRTGLFQEIRMHTGRPQMLKSKGLSGMAGNTFYRRDKNVQRHRSTPLLQPPPRHEVHIYKARQKWRKKKKKQKKDIYKRQKNRMIEIVVQGARSSIVVEHPYAILGNSAVGHEILRVDPLRKRGQHDILRTSVHV